MVAVVVAVAKAKPLTLIVTRLHLAAPGTVVERPEHGGADAGLKVVARPPAELAFDP